MELMVTKKVFNPDLQGKAVWVEGCTEDGDLKLRGFYLVQNVGTDHLDLVNYRGQTIRIYDIDFHPENFEPVKLTVLKEVNEK